MCLAKPHKIISVDGDTARVSYRGISYDASTVFCEETLRPGQYCSVHVGFVQSVIDEKEAEGILKMIDSFGEETK
jgi:hydrogenase assembly chaperone HypC/HupF